MDKHSYYILTSALLAGLIPIFVRLAESIGSIGLSFLRVFLAALLLGLFLLATRKIDKPLLNKEFAIFCILHGFLVLGYIVSILLVDIALAAVLFFTFPIWMAVFGYFTFKEKLTKKQFFALIIAFVGLVIVFTPGSFEENLLGGLPALLAGIGAGFLFVLSKKFKKYHKPSLTFWQNTIGSLVLLPFIFFTPITFQPIDLTYALAIGIITAVQFILYYKGLERVKSGRAGTIMFLEAIIPIILAIFIFSEIPAITTVIGGVLILYSAYNSMK